MNRFWDCKLSGAPPLLSFVLGGPRSIMRTLVRTRSLSAVVKGTVAGLLHRRYV
jgi:hypothetical protein